MVVSLSALDIFLGAIGIFLVHRLFRGSRKKPALPPGPRGLPIIGNVLDMPTEREWLTFAGWGERWGDIVSVTLLGQVVVILDSPKHAMEMLEKRSNIYSDRPKLMMGGEIVGWSQTLALTPYGERFREYRRFIHRLIGGRSNIQRFHPLVKQETHNFLRRVLSEPDRVSAHIRKTAGAIILMMSHGYKVEEGSDPIVDVVDVATEQFAASTQPGAFLVDVLPVLQYVPQWVPGAGFQKIAASWKKTLNDMADIPFNFVKAQMNAGTVIPNFTSELLETETLDADKVHNIKWSAASLYSGGADTTVSAIYGFFMVMTLFPEAQRKAQAELDAVIGSDRLPFLADRERLPYVEALVSEVFRFNPVAPLGVPHRVTEDDIYSGYLIPKGTIVIPNIWKFLHDPDVYHDPLIFDPSRFLSSEGKAPEPDPREACFGFGRRICPGLLLADVSVWLSCAMTLAAFDIAHVIENGKPVEIENVYLSGTISHPKPFRCSVKPRSAKAEALITAVDETH